MPKSTSIASILLAIGITVAGCAAQTQPPQAPPTSQAPVSISPAVPVVTPPPTDPAKMAEPAGGKKPDGIVVDPTYILGAGDQISVSIWGDSQFDGTYIISPDGTFSMKLIGAIPAAGKTIQQLQDTIDKAAQKELKKPRSSVNLLGSHSKHVYFDGDGIAPGAMDLVMPIHLLEALSAHGCCKDFANKNKIQVLREGKPLTHNEGGKPSVYFKYKDMLSGKHTDASPLLQDGDHVIVP